MVTSNSGSAASSSRAVSSRRSRSSSVSVPRPTSRRTSSSHDGGFEEDEQRLGHRLAHLPGALQVDLQQRRPAGGQRLARPGRAGCRSGRALCTTAHSSSSSVGDHPVELLVGDEPVVHAVHLAGTRRAGWSRRPRSRPRGGARGRHAATVPLPTAVGPARTVSRDAVSLRRTGSVARGELALERGDLLGAEPAHPAALGDAEPLHHLPGADLAEARASTAAGRRPASCR